METTPRRSLDHMSHTTALHPSPVSLLTSSPASLALPRGHSARGSGSSSPPTSSPVLRDSFDLVPSRLGKVTEEPREKDELDGYTLVDVEVAGLHAYDECFPKEMYQSSPLELSIGGGDYNLSDQDAWSTSSCGRHQPKRQRSVDHTSATTSNRFSNRFNTISRRWKNRSCPTPELSIITNSHPPPSRSSSATSSQIISPALSAISKHESYLPPSPIRTNLDETFYDSDPLPLASETQQSEQEEDQGHVTTPLLPPIFSELTKTESPVHSPLQSPSIAPTSAIMHSRTSFDTTLTTMLPSPPLSSRQSDVSVHQRSRTNTTILPPLMDIPPLQLLDGAGDPWALQLGHADFHIHPEPYLPEQVGLDSYIEFRANWDHARTSYAKHLARTIEHYGSTSKVFRLTEAKWNSVDDVWKCHNERMSKILTPVLARAGGNEAVTPDSLQSSAVLEKPITRIIIPSIDAKSGKFPELGDGEIVGPMSVGPPRSATSRQKSPSPYTPPDSPRKGNLRKFLSELFART